LKYLFIIDYHTQRGCAH